MGLLTSLPLTSSEGVRNLKVMLGEHAMHALREVAVFASHARIGTEARAAGFVNVIETEAGDDGLLQALTKHFG